MTPRTNPHNRLLRLMYRADSGDPCAQYTLGVVHATGHGTKHAKYDAARAWFRLSAEGGHAAARLNVAIMQFYGWGGPADRVCGRAAFGDALKQYACNRARTAGTTTTVAAACGGDVASQFLLGIISQFGLHGAEPSASVARQWYTIAARRGLRVARESLYILYGVGVEGSVAADVLL